MQLYVDDANTLVFTTGRVLVLQWRAAITHAGMDAVERAYKKLVETFGRGLYLFTIVAEPPVPSKELRHRVEMFLRQGNGVFIASVAAYTAKGVRAALVRQVAFALALSARTTYRHEPVASIEKAVTWLEQNAGFKGGMELRATLAAMGCPP